MLYHRNPTRIDREMRSKPKARRLAKENPNEGFQRQRQVHSNVLISEHSEMEMGLEKPMSTINCLGDIPIPQDFQLRQSRVYPGLGLWTKVPLESGQKFGPFAGVFKSTMDDPSSAWELVDETGKVKGWIDAGDTGTGNWMKYVRSTESQRQRNIIAIQSGDQIFYQVACHISAGEEMVLSVNDGVYSERDLEDWPKSPRISTHEERELSCDSCGEIFRSTAALVQHETKQCDVRTTRFYLNPSRNRSHWRDDSRSPSPEASEPEQDSTWVKQEMIQDAVSGSPPEHHTSESSPTPTGSTSPPGADPLIEPYFRSEGDSGLYKQFNCENCDKIFTDPSNLQRHIRSTHVGARCHACTDCGKTFATSSGLKQHQHIHSSVKPFQCEVCLRAYTQFSNLCRHKRMHADCRQQIKCKDCGQAFSTTTSLSKHKRFCEGVLRNGSRFGILPSPNKQTAPLAPNVSQSSAFSSPYMNIFAPRPAFPFFPPMGTGFPVFPSGHPMTAITPPMLHDGKFSTSISPAVTTPYSSAAVGELDRSTEMKKAGSEGSEGTDLSEVSTPASDLETSASDVDSDNGTGIKPRQLLRPAHSGSNTSSPAIVSPYSTSSLLSYSSKTGPTSGPCDLSVRNINDSGVCDLSVKEKKNQDDSEQPFDLSKSAMKKINSADQPLDLSQKSITADTPRKTHIFGDIKQHESPEKKLHAAFPMANPFMLEQVMMMNKEKLHSIHEEAARMLALGPRFPLPASPYGPMASLMTQNALDPSKSLSPLMKLENHSSVVPYGSSISGKVKDRYSCRYCGKIFPRSANLTRHLRTHTGEQPYKCKYCERSFSISSNLQRHVRNIHNKEKPFKCPICDRCFGQQTNLDRHLKRHETEGPNIADSPSPQNELEADDAMSLHERESSYLQPGESDDSDVAGSPRKFEHLDANFSLTAQIEKQSKLDFDRVSEHEQQHDAEMDEDDRDEIPAKIPRLENNNIAESAILNRLPNGFHPGDMIPKATSGVITCT